VPGSLASKVKSASVEPVSAVGAVMIVVFGALVSIVHVYVSGEASVFPAASVARTSKVWSPSASPARLSGLVQALQEPPSSRHSNVEPPSLEEKEKLAPVAFVGSPGWAVIVVSGAAVSIVQVKVAGVASVLPAASVARTSKVRAPSARSVNEWGLEQALQAPPSRRHSKVEPPSLEVNEKLGSFELVGSLGCAVIVVFGAVASIVQV
jgi:hypothetical protein